MRRIEEVFVCDGDMSEDAAYAKAEEMAYDMILSQEEVDDIELDLNSNDDWIATIRYYSEPEFSWDELAGLD